jgi:hypothetical protein
MSPRRTAIAASMVTRAALLLLLAGAVGGCASKADRVADKEDLLAAAGFTVAPASTPTRQEEIRGLPSHVFLSQIQGGKVIFLYADPLVCNCLYIGSQAAYDRYKQEVFQRQIATEQQVTAQMYQNMAWDWGPWGPGWWVGPP